MSFSRRKRWMNLVISISSSFTRVCSPFTASDFSMRTSRIASDPIGQVCVVFHFYGAELTFTLHSLSRLVTSGDHLMRDRCRFGRLQFCNLHSRHDWYSILLHIHGYNSNCWANNFYRSIVSISERQVSKTRLAVGGREENVPLIIETGLRRLGGLQLVESLLQTIRYSHSKRRSYYIWDLIRGESLLRFSFRIRQAINREDEYKYEPRSERVWKRRLMGYFVARKSGLWVFWSFFNASKMMHISPFRSDMIWATCWVFETTSMLWL